MDLKAKTASLSEIERKTLKALTSELLPLEEISRKTNQNIDAVRRAANWLQEKEFALTTPIKRKKLTLTATGKHALENGLPEDKMIEVLLQNESMSFDELRKKGNFTEQEFNIALGLNRKNAFIVIIKNDQPKILLTEVAKEFLGKENVKKKILLQVSREEKLPRNDLLKQLIVRGLISEIEVGEWSSKITPEGEKALSLKEFSGPREFNIQDPVPKIFIGKKQPYIQFLDSIRKKLVNLGFKEMPERLINQEFYNFDVLFQPQNHPARTWTDTYQLKRPSMGKLPDKEKVNAIKEAHEHGGKTSSIGWRYNWSAEIAQRLMPTAHGTAADARQMVEGVEFPRKYFVINRCFRPDVLDATHLIEFNQLDGFIVGNDLNFPKLLGILKEFATEIAGATEVRFYPDYYPFTEPSVQLSAKHPELGWVEFAGAGIFRPEITESLGIKEPVLAWGMGVDRLAMFKLGIKDIRHLFSDNLTWLRKSKMVID